MASPGGGKIKSKGEHSPVKPYDQRKSFFERVTAGIKDVLRPSWMAADPTDVASCSTRTSPKSTGTATLQEKGQIPNNEHSPAEVRAPKSMSMGIPAPLLTSSSREQPISSHRNSPGTNTSSLSQSPGVNTTTTTHQRLWSLTAGEPPGIDHLHHHHHHHPLFPNNPSSSSPLARSGSGSSARVLTGGGSRSVSSSPWSSGKNGAITHQRVQSGASQRHAVTGDGRALLQRSERRVGLSSPSLDFSSQLNKSPAPHSFSGYGPHISPMPSNRNVTVSSPVGRSLHLKHRNTLSSHSFSERLSSVEAAASVSPLKRQKMTPEMSRKGKSLQPAIRGQPAFSMAAFCSPTLNSPPVRQTVTPKPVNRSNSAVLSSSTTRILRTFERLADAKRARVDMEDSDSILSYTPPSSYRNNSRSWQLQRTFQSESVETRSPAASPAVPSTSGCEEAAAPVPDEGLGSPASPGQPQEADDDVAIAHDTDNGEDNICKVNDSDHNESSDDDIQIIEPPEQAAPRKDCGSSNSHSTSSLGKSLQQPATHKEKALMFSATAKTTEQCVPNAGLIPAGVFGSALPPSPSLYTSPSSWGSTAAKPKSILAGNSKPDSGNRKSVSFQQKDQPGKDGSGGSTPVAPLLSGSVMDILAKHTSSSAASKPSTQFNVDNKGLSSPAKSGSDNLFAKFAAPAGSWECDVCMVSNTANCPQCVACQTPRPGASDKGNLGTATSLANVSSGGLQQSSTFSSSPGPATGGFKPAAAATTGGFTHAAAATGGFTPAAAATGGFKFGASPSLSSPAFSAPTTSVSQPVSSSAGLVFGQSNPTSSSSKATSASGFQFGKPAPVFSSSSPSSPALPAVSSSSSAGFVFGKPTLVSSGNAVTTTAGSLLKSPTTSTPAASAAAFPGPTTLGTVCAGAASSSGSAGFTFDKPSSVGSGFQFGVKSDASSTSKDNAASVQFGAQKSVNPCQSVKSSAAGFQFGSTSSIASPVLGTSTAFSSSSSASSFNSSAASNNHDSLAQCERTKGNNKSEASPSVTVTDRKETDAGSSASSDVDRNCDRVSASATPSLPVSSSTTGGFQFSSPSYASSIFTASAKVAAKDNDSAKQNTDLKASSVSGFTFGKTVPKTSENGFSFGTMDTEVSSSDAGFSFGKTDPNPSSTSGFSLGKNNSKPSSDNGFSFGKTDPKPSSDNGFSFEKTEQKTSSSDNGFSFGKTNSKPSSDNGSSFGKLVNKSKGLFTSAVAPSKQNGPNLFTASTSSKGFTFGVPASLGPLTKAPFATGPSSATSAGFSFASPSLKKAAEKQQNAFADLVQSSSLSSTSRAEAEPDSTSSDVVLIDDDDEDEEAEPSMGKQASSSALLDSSQSGSSGFVFGAHSTAASSKDTMQPSGTASRGSAHGGLSAVGAGSQSNPVAAAAAASPLFSEPTAVPVKGFSFSGSTQSSFSFGSASSSNNSTAAFQFASPKSEDTSPVQNHGGAFSVGKATPSAQGSNPAPAPAFSAPTPAAGLANRPDNITVGTGESPRKIKRAVRRVPKN